MPEDVVMDQATSPPGDALVGMAAGIMRENKLLSASSRSVEQPTEGRDSSSPMPSPTPPPLEPKTAEEPSGGGGADAKNDADFDESVLQLPQRLSEPSAKETKEQLKEEDSSSPPPVAPHPPPPMTNGHAGGEEEDRSEEEKIKEYLKRSDTAVIYPEPVGVAKEEPETDGAETDGGMATIADEGRSKFHVKQSGKKRKCYFRDL